MGRKPVPSLCRLRGRDLLQLLGIVGSKIEDLAHEWKFKFGMPFGGKQPGGRLERDECRLEKIAEREGKVVLERDAE